jgi:hypothetical protein
MRPFHFYDLDSTLWDTHSKEVVIDKRSPGKTILRLTNIQSFQTSNLNKEYKLEINYNGETRYLDPAVWEKIKKLSKNITLADVGISGREFTQDEFLDKQAKHLEIFLNVLNSIKGKDVSVGIITARSKQKEHSELLKKFKDTVKQKLGIDITKIYFVNDNSVSDPDSTAYKKVKILLEYLIGLKIKGDCFTNLKQDSDANEVYFYDDIEKNIEAANNINYLFIKLFHETPDNIKSIIIEKMDKSPLKLITNKITNNKLNPFVTTENILKKPN